MPKQKPNKPAPAVKAAMKKAASSGQAKLLDYTWIDQIHILQAQVVSSLGSDQIHWLRQREKDSITKHIKGGNPVIGWVEDNKLQGFALLALPDNDGVSNTTNYPVVKADQTMIVQSFIVAPGLKGEGQAEALMAEITKEARVQKRPILIARIATDNGRSQSFFKNAGFRKIEGDYWFENKDHPNGGYHANHYTKVVDLKRPVAKPAAEIGRVHKDSRPTVWGS